MPTENNSFDVTPLAERMRPQTPEMLVGQTHIWGPTSPLRKLVEHKKLRAVIFWGPPGTGKTSLANIISRYLTCPVAYLSAVRSGVKDMRDVIELSKEQQMGGGAPPTLMFVDEIHRLNKAQQDVLLPALESGEIRFIGSTTENPSFEVNKAVLSRCLTFKFNQLTRADLVELLKRAASTHTLNDIDDSVLVAIAHSSDGDGRRALNLLEAMLAAVPPDTPTITPELVREFADQLLTKYDKDGEQHYDIISAFIKSVRASHPDAAVYYLARMIDAGEDAMFIARRLVILASEDIGNANPTALLLATAAMQATHMVGYPEARIILSQATTYLAASPKSNKSYNAINQALADVKAYQSLEVPLHLRNPVTSLLKELGYGDSYAYAHDDPAGAKKLNYLPAELKGRRYYEPSLAGVEAQLRANLEKLRPQAD